MKQTVIKEITEHSREVCEAVARLLGDLSDEQFPFDEARLKKIISTDGTHLFVAYADDTAAGMYTLAVCELPTGTRIWLEDVVVSRGFQGQGLGRKLVTHAIGEARRICPSATMMLTSRPSRIAANHIYSTLFEKKETNVYFLKP